MLKIHPRDVLILCGIAEVISIVSGLVIFSVLGFLAKKTGQTIQDVTDGGPGLAFIAYPTALTQLPLHQFWTFLFFLMLGFVALDGLYVGVEGFLTSCTDIWPKLRKWRKSFLFFICLVNFFGSSIFFTGSGIYFFEIFLYYGPSGWHLLL